MKKSMILDASGAPMKRASVAAAPYAAADPVSQDLSSWHPSLGSADRDYLGGRDKVVSRARDIVRNSGWASSYLTRKLDNVIGPGWRLSSKPDYKALGLSHKWAHDFALEVEGRWRLYAEDPGFYIDATRQDDFNGLLRLLYRHYATEGECIVLPLWFKDKPGNRAATTFQVIDPDRLSNPMGRYDDESIRGGIEIDIYGKPVAYHLRRAHPGDVYAMGSSAYQWDRVPRETYWGRARVIHAYEKLRGGQSRGVSPLAAVLERFKMLDRYDRVELQAAILNAILAAFIESPMDHELLMDSMDDGNLSKYQSERSEFHRERSINLGGVKINTLYPGEKFTFQTASRPNSAFAEFESACLRNIAAGTGMSYEQLTADWSQVNYSSARAAIQEIWKTLVSERTTFAKKCATPMFHLWLEEEIDEGRIKLPAGAPSFHEATAAYGRVNWIGTGRGYVDPEKEGKAENMRLNNMTSTLEDECAAQGKDYIEVLDQRAREQKELTERGLNLPDWASSDPKTADPFGE